MGMREGLVFAGVLGIATLGAYRTYEETKPHGSRIYLRGDGQVAYQGIHGERHYGQLTDKGRMLDDVRRAARDHSLPVGAASLAIGWAGSGRGFDAEHCAIYAIGDRGGDPLVKPLTFVQSLGAGACSSILPYVEAAAVGGPNGVSPNVAVVPGIPNLNQTPTPPPTPHP